MSAWNSALLSTALFVVGGIVVLMLAAQTLPRPERNDVARRTAWIAIGGAGMPMALVSTVELVGPFYVGAVILISALLARWRRLDHVIALLASVIVVLFVAGTVMRSVGSSHSSGWLTWVLIVEISGLAMTVAAAKLGRMLAGRMLRRSTRDSVRV